MKIKMTIHKDMLILPSILSFTQTTSFHFFQELNFLFLFTLDCMKLIIYFKIYLDQWNIRLNVALLDVAVIYLHIIDIQCRLAIHIMCTGNDSQGSTNKDIQDVPIETGKLCPLNRTAAVRLYIICWSKAH